MKAILLTQYKNKYQSMQDLNSEVKDYMTKHGLVLANIFSMKSDPLGKTSKRLSKIMRYIHDSQENYVLVDHDVSISQSDLQNLPLFEELINSGKFAFHLMPIGLVINKLSAKTDFFRWQLHQLFTMHYRMNKSLEKGK